MARFSAGKQFSKIVLVGLAGLLLAGCGQGKPAQVGTPGVGEGQQIEDRVSQLSKQFGVTLPAGIDRAALNPVDGSASSGLATRETRDGTTTLTILANLPDTDRGYTARLTGGDGQKELGALRIAKGGWLLERTTNADPTVFRTVEVLSGETVILRGEFQ